MELPAIRFSEFKHYHFLDQQEQEMGTLEDIIFDPQTLKSTHLLLGSSFVEEFLEEIGELDNIDEMAPIDTIQRIEDDYVFLEKKLEELPTTEDDGSLPINGILKSKLETFPLYYENNKLDGELYDVIISSEFTEFLFLIWDFNEQMQMKGFYQEFLLKFDASLLSISLDKEQIQIKKSLKELSEIVSQKCDPKMKGREIVEISDNK